MLPEIIPLESADRYSAGEIGAKAWNLGRLLRHGFPVPPGFCISAEAYARHMLSGDIPDHLKRAVTSAESDRTGDLPQLLAVLRHSIIQAPLPPDLSSGLQQEYQRLAQMPVAVRSSATAEDLAGHSFAGLYESFLGVTSQQELADASKKCWASLWTERAFLYRQRKGFDHNAARMAVIVQTVIPAEVAGVLFTADPASGATDCLLIEAAFGLGEAVVSGKVTPDRYVLAREGLDILERVVSHKKVQVIARHGGVQEIAIDDHKACSPALDESSARELAALGLKIETAFGDV
jgi:pyruvate,water dikinase